jgi:single-stranded DNA-binding protein
MSEYTIDNNIASLAGEIASELKFSHEIYSESFYNFFLRIPRLSSSYDTILITVSDRLLDIHTLTPGKQILVDGQFRSYNNMNPYGSKLLLTLFAREIEFINDYNEIKNPNQIYLCGFICKKPVYRTTPFGREITDLLLAINRPYNKSDYIPCIAWGRNARYSRRLKVGDNIRIWGRIQSRDYQKKYDDGPVISLLLQYLF